MSEELKLSATNFGFDGGWVADILTQYGPDVLALAVEAARNGLSVPLVVEIVQKFGPALLQLIVSLWNKQNMAAFVAPCAKAHCCKKQALAATQDSVVVNGPILTGLDASLIGTLIEQYLPVILQKFGPVIVQAIVSALTSALNNNQSDVIQAIVQAILNALNNVPTPAPATN